MYENIQQFVDQYGFGIVPSSDVVKKTESSINTTGGTSSLIRVISTLSINSFFNRRRKRKPINRFVSYQCYHHTGTVKACCRSSFLSYRIDSIPSTACSIAPIITNIHLPR